MCSHRRPFASRVLRELAALVGRSVSDLLDRLAEQALRRQIMAQCNARIAELLAEPEDRRHWQEDFQVSEASPAEVAEPEPPSVKPVRGQIRGE